MAGATTNLSDNDRRRVHEMRAAGQTYAAIGKAVGRHKTTIGRVLAKPPPVSPAPALDIDWDETRRHTLATMRQIMDAAASTDRQTSIRAAGVIVRMLPPAPPPAGHTDDPLTTAILDAMGGPAEPDGDTAPAPPDDSDRE